MASIALDPESMVLIYPIVKNAEGETTGSDLPIRVSLADLAVFVQDYTPPAP